MVDRECADLVVAAVDRVTRLELERLDRVGEAAEDTAQGGEEIEQPRWAVEPERQLAATEREALQHPR